MWRICASNISGSTLSLFYLVNSGMVRSMHHNLRSLVLPFRFRDRLINNEYRFLIYFSLRQAGRSSILIWARPLRLLMLSYEIQLIMKSLEIAYQVNQTGNEEQQLILMAITQINVSGHFLKIAAYLRRMKPYFSPGLIQRRRLSPEMYMSRSLRAYSSISNRRVVVVLLINSFSV